MEGKNITRKKSWVPHVLWYQSADDMETDNSNLLYKWRHFPVKSTSLLVFISLSSVFSSDSFILTHTFQHAFAMWWIVCWAQKIHQEKLCFLFILFFFILMTNLESFPDETFITLNAFCWRGNWPETHQATTCIYSMLTSLLSISVKHLWVILPTFLTYDWLFEIRHLNFWYVPPCLYSQRAIFTGQFEVKH